MSAPEMEATVAALLDFGKGILAADESLSTIGIRFKALNIPSTEVNRRDYRELLLSTPWLGDFISGVILFDETIRQRTEDGITMVELLARQGIIPGIKVDKGTVAQVNFPGEKITQGLDGLLERLIEYRALGARFTKWRAVFAVSDSIPSHACIQANSASLAQFAALSQEAGLVPIVEPEILMTGNHTIERCEEVATATLKRVFGALFDHRVELEHILLKTGMILSGAGCPQQYDFDTVAACTLRCLSRTVPAAVPGIVFLSGGQEAGIATERLNAIARASDGPWRLTFSFGRALQAPALDTWRGRRDKGSAAQDALHTRARDNSLAVQGIYSPASESQPYPDMNQKSQTA